MPLPCGPLLKVPPLAQRLSARWQRGLTTLAIETSCDDTCVAILEKDGAALHIHHHERLTSNNLRFRGIHPIAAQDSHQTNLASMIQSAVQLLPVSKRNASVSSNPQRPDLISVTRGPGMRSSLFTGLDTAKGLSVAWDVPLIAVNHMQAHALTPRLVCALKERPEGATNPTFPFLSLLVSGGHTMLINSKSLIDHPTLASTLDVALGDAIDKTAKSFLPEALIASANSVAYGPILESFAFPRGKADYPDQPGASVARVFTPPLSQSSAGSKSKALEYSFSGLCSYAERLATGSQGNVLTDEERRCLAIDAMRVAFEHLASRVVIALKQMKAEAPTVLVLSGGVAANGYLRHV